MKALEVEVICNNFDQSKYKCFRKRRRHFMALFLRTGLSEVKCMADQITVTVFKQMVFDLVEFIDGSIVYLGHDGFNQSKCISSESGGQLVVVLRWPFEDCGTIARWVISEFLINSFGKK